jgi:hypothetical protein
MVARARRARRVPVWKRGYPHRGLPVTTAVECVNDIAQRRGGRNPENVANEVEQDPHCPIRPLFTMRGPRAIRKCHILEARELLRSIKFRIVVGRVVVQPETRMWVRVSATRTYEPTVEALTDEDTRHEVLEQVLHDIAAIREKYRRFTALSEIIGRLGEIVDEFGPN